MRYPDVSPVGGRAEVGEAPARRRTHWPLLAVAAGVLGAFATIVMDVHVAEADGGMTLARVDDVSVVKARIGFAVGYVVVALLIVLAAAWRRHVEPRVPGSTAARVVSAGLGASAAALTLGYGWRGAMGIYGEGGPEDEQFDQTARYVYYVLNDFGAWIGWLGVLVAAFAIAWMALRERTVSRWIGWVSVLAAGAPSVAMAVMSVPGMPALTMPFWLVVAGLGLTFGKSTITR